MSALETHLYRRNPFVRVRFDAMIECDLLLDGRTFVLPSAALVGALSALTGVRPREEFVVAVAECLEDPCDAPAVVDAFIAADLLVDATDEWPEMAAVEHWIERGWLDALLFHLRARTIRFDDEGVADPAELHSRLLHDVVDQSLELWTPQSEGATTDLPVPIDRDDLPPLGEVLLQRRSNRPWARGSMSLTELSTLLYHASAETRSLRRAARERGATDPGALLNSSFSALELLVAAHNVEDLAPGLYAYDVATHQLVLARSGGLRDDFVEMCAGQARAGGGAATFVIAAEWRQYFMRYRHAHAYRVLMMNAGELGQKILLIATGLGLSTFLTPAFRESVADRVLGFDPLERAAIEAIGIG